MFHIRFTALALAVASFSQPVFAADSEAATVIVTASRFAETEPRLPANISVITREDIRSSPLLSLPELLSARAGIGVSSLYGRLGTDATVDLRGFGDSAGSNTLVLLDGQRLNPLDAASLNWSSIPLASVSRIEILRGSGTVLYGDRASGGVINIITDKSAKPGVNAQFTGGSFGYRALDVHGAGGDGATYVNLTGHVAGSDGWRQNSRGDEWNVAGRVGNAVDGREVFADFALHRAASGLPGAVFRNQYLTTPDMSRSPLDNQTRDGFRLRPGFAIRLAPGLESEGEVSYSRNRYHNYSYNFTFGSSYVLNSVSDTWSVTPRLRWRHGLGTLTSETVFGLDYYDGKVGNDSLSDFFGVTTNTQRASQQSHAFYVQNVTGLTSDLDLSLGVRSQRMKQAALDMGAGMSDAAARRLNAWEIGLTAQATQTLRFYGKAGRTFRFPNTDELFGYNPITFQSIFRGDLRPQQGDVQELGARWRVGDASAQMSVYRMNLRDEIAYDGINAFANVNLPDTRRQGLELEGQWLFARTWSLRLAHAYTEAVFQSGASVPMVPRNRLTADMGWRGGEWGNWNALVTHVGRQRVSGDTLNVRETDPGYTTVDLKAGWDIQSWKLSGRILNLLNRRYAPLMGYSTTYNDYYYFPADPRSVFVSLEHRFR